MSSLNERRESLKAIVARMGPVASPAQIRQEAYRVGFGTVNAEMLVFVRNELWPDREKRGGGRTGKEPVTAFNGLPASIPGLPDCPACGSKDSRVLSVYKRKGTRRSRNGDQLSGSVWRRRQCKQCNEKFGTVDEIDLPLKISKRRLMHQNATGKQCSKCDRVLPVSHFSKKSGDADLYRPHCNECSRQARAAHSFRQTRETYGISEAEYQKIFERQGGLCAICRRPGKGKGERHYPLCFDHSHVTGDFRGLLCDKCNLGVGNFDDDFHRLLAAAEYLKNAALPQ